MDETKKERKENSTNLKNAWSLSQNSGFATVWWYVDSVSFCAAGPGRTPASMVSMMSFSTVPGASLDGDGDKTTLGIL
jgi:hypothetical protein